MTGTELHYRWSGLPVCGAGDYGRHLVRQTAILPDVDCPQCQASEIYAYEVELAKAAERADRAGIAS